jgi:hypothetical protein
MTIVSAFLNRRTDDLFSSVAAFADARALEMFDVADAQKHARQTIDAAINNAINPRNHSPGHRIALIKGDAGSGKSHVLTTTLKRAASKKEIYPAVLQLTAPVKCEEYEIWLLDAIMRQLSARHFADDNNHSPIRRLAGRLLDRLDLAEKQEFLSAVEDLDNEDRISLSLRLAERIRLEAQDRLSEIPPSPGFLAVVILAGFGDSSALGYLRHGKITERISELGLDEITTSHHRIDLLTNLGLTAQIVSAGIALGFDQVENAARLGSENLFVHTLTQAVRLAESIANCAVIVVALGDEYDKIMDGRGTTTGLPVSDRDRIEREPPVPARLDSGTPEFLRAVIAQRLAVLRQRSSLPQAPGSLDPLPNWFLSRISEQRNVRSALLEVAAFRLRAIELGRLPSQTEYNHVEGPRRSDPPADLDKEWADFQDLAPVTLRLLDRTKAELIAWWVQEASREHANSATAEVTLSSLSDDCATPLIDIAFKVNGVAIEHRQLALCEAPNRNYQLANQVEGFLNAATGVPAVLRTNGFPKGRQAQVASALRRLEALFGMKLDLNDTEWHNLHRAKDFCEKWGQAPNFIAWRRSQQWLIQLLGPLQPLIALPRVIEPGSVEKSVTPKDVRTPSRQPTDGQSSGDGAAGKSNHEASAAPFPVHIGTSFDGLDVKWDPYREAPNHLNNFSVLVTGDAGSGKTQTIRVLIDAACRKGLAVTIFDFKADYCSPDFATPLGIEVVDVRAHGLPFNPLQPPPRAASGVQPIEHAYEIAGILRRVFGLGAIQEGLLRNAITRAYHDTGIQVREWIDPSSISWPTFDLVLDGLRNERSAAALVTKLSLLSDLGLFRAPAIPRASLQDFLNKRVCLKLSELPTDEIKSALAEILIVQLHGYALRGEQPRRLTRMMVFDEAHRVKDSKRLESLAREGRAFGVGIVIGTQFPGDVPETIAGNLATQLYLMNNQATHRRFVVSQIIGTTSTSEAHTLLDQISHLGPLEGLYANTHHNGVLVRVKPHHARQDHGASS